MQYEGATAMQYRNLVLMALLSFISMYLLMYSMIDNTTNLYTNLNQFYMALIMTFPMVMIEVLVMGSMYPNKRLNKVIMLTALVLLGVFFILLRKQSAVGDREFVRSMIPHHAAALLMCRENHLQDPELKELCKNISRTQQSEIDFMKAKLASLK